MQDVLERLEHGRPRDRRAGLERGGARRRRFGVRWAKERRSAVLIVPSFVARIEHNVVINPAHDHYGRITSSLHEPVWWDELLFAAAGSASSSGPGVPELA